MLPSLAISLYYREGDASSFVIAIIITVLVGCMGLLFKPPKKVIRYRDAFMIVTLGWLLISIFGAIPFYLQGSTSSFVDAFFETVSGFTTTGASVITDIEGQPHGILFWRSFTHWLGGMGILVFALALLPAIGVGTIHLFKAESPGPTPGRLVPRVKQTAKILYLIYTVITLIHILALVAAGMPLFDAVNHAFASLGTGGFSIRNASIGAYQNPAYEWIITLFTFIAGVNFSLYYEALRGNIKTLFRDREFQMYSLVVITAIILIALNIYPLYHGNLSKAVRDSSFQVVTIITTTGYSTLDYEIWPDFSKAILVILMFFGGCAGSTGGGIKHIRILLAFKYVKREFYRMIHPKAVVPIKIGNKTVPEEVIQHAMGFILVYLAIFVISSLLLLTQGMDTISSFSAVAATLGNIGPGFGMVGPAMNYAGLTVFSKLVLSACMILGRLEIYTVLVLLSPAFWKE